uniref:Uncharacterized protein n=1 Tax=Leersia perrieri TaxID=77586 RepID=A0A0D9VFM3_9ORYZ
MFRFYGKEHTLTWTDLSSLLLFHDRCKTDLVKAGHSQPSGSGSAWPSASNSQWQRPLDSTPSFRVRRSTSSRGDFGELTRRMDTLDLRTEEIGQNLTEHMA